MNLTSIGAVFSILLVIVGGACVLLLVSTRTLRDSRDDQEKRIKFLEEERVRDKAEIAEKDVAIRFWRSAATGDEKLESLTALLTQHHGEARQNWVVVTAGLGHLGTAIDHMSEASDHTNELLEHLTETLSEDHGE